MGLIFLAHFRLVNLAFLSVESITEPD